ncbi:hypothetical protein V6U90_30710, partial [Micromonospora sp. CPCC 206060]|uniref:hypothetical protein n=1 Tax=Micromonospora sp. CPCC 206060 TaxID=3122406 RepID=UPI002FF329B0
MSTAVVTWTRPVKAVPYRAGASSEAMLATFGPGSMSGTALAVLKPGSTLLQILNGQVRPMWSGVTGVGWG